MSAHSAVSLRFDPNVCDTCAIRHASLCGALSRDEIAELNAIVVRTKLSPGQLHVIEGEQARDFVNVTSGTAKLVRGAEDGRTQIVGLLFPSDFVGGAGNAHSELDFHSIEAVTELELCVFPRDRFDALLEKYPMIEHRILSKALNDLHQAREWMVLLGRKTAQEKVASFLLYVAEKMRNEGCKEADSFNLPLGRVEIADYIGLTIETVSRHITKLKKDGVLVMDGSKTIKQIDYERLTKRAGF